MVTDNFQSQWLKIIKVHFSLEMTDKVGVTQLHTVFQYLAFFCHLEAPLTFRG